MKSLADDLPLELAQHIHPDWRKNEQDYLAIPDQLLLRIRRIAFGHVEPHGPALSACLFH
jgi:hypothetical protein